MPRLIVDNGFLRGGGRDGAGAVIIIIVCKGVGVGFPLRVEFQGAGNVHEAALRGTGGVFVVRAVLIPPLNEMVTGLCKGILPENHSIGKGKIGMAGRLRAAVAPVAVILDIVADGLPLGVEGHIFGNFFLLAGVAEFIRKFGVRIPARNVITGMRGRIQRFGHGGPDRPQVCRGALGARKVQHVYVLVVILARAVNGGAGSAFAPAGERIRERLIVQIVAELTIHVIHFVTARKAAGTHHGGNVVFHVHLIGGTAAVRAVAVEVDLVLDGVPLGGEGHVAPLARGNGHVIGIIGGVRRPVAGSLRYLPAVENIAGSRGRGQRGGAFDLHGLGCRRYGTAVRIKGGGVFDLRPVGENLDGRGGRITRVAVADLGAARGSRVPTVERIAVAGGRGQREGFWRPLRHHGYGTVICGGKVVHLLSGVIGGVAELPTGEGI